MSDETISGGKNIMRINSVDLSVEVTGQSIYCGVCMRISEKKSKLTLDN